jgi:hypothetical protein
MAWFNYTLNSSNDFSAMRKRSTEPWLMDIDPQCLEIVGVSGGWSQRRARRSKWC